MVNKMKMGVFGKNDKHEKINISSKFTDGNNQLFK